MTFYGEMTAQKFIYSFIHLQEQLFHGQGGSVGTRWEYVLDGMG